MFYPPALLLMDLWRREERILCLLTGGSFLIAVGSLVAGRVIGHRERRERGLGLSPECEVNNKEESQRE